MSRAKRFGFLASTLALLLLATSGPAEDPPKGAGGNPPARKPIPPGQATAGGALTPFGPYDVLIRGDRCWVGQYDKDGNFIPDSAHWSFRRNAGGGGGPYNFRGAHQVDGPTASAEHRSGRLILGTMVKRVFVPEIGSKVLDIHKDFDVKKPERIVYNIYDTGFAFWAEQRKKKVERDILKQPVPPAAGVPNGWKLLPFREAFPHWPEDKNPWFARVIDQVMEFGHLSDDGEFIPEYGLPVMPFVKTKDAARAEFQDGSLRPFHYTLPYDGAWGRKEVDEEEVYEFRSGRLIKGTLHKTGNFVPEIGSKILDFKDYDPYSRRRIYNLPGVLRPVKK